MPTADYSSSRLTRVRNSVALASFNRANLAAVNAGVSVQREQPSMQLGAVVTARHLTIANTNPPAAEGDCGCTDPVYTNPGGC
jgi:hypothetical protein